MPKMKTHRGSAKRFHVTSGGKFKRSKAYATHILTKKTTKRKRGLRQASSRQADRGRLKRLLPYPERLPARIPRPRRQRAAAAARAASCVLKSGRVGCRGSSEAARRAAAPEST